MINSGSYFSGNDYYLGSGVFDWIRDSKTLIDNDLVSGYDQSYQTWYYDWSYGKVDSLCIYSCQWFNEWCLGEYFASRDGWAQEVRIGENYMYKVADNMLRALPANPSKTFYWGGACLLATNKSMGDEKLGSRVLDIIDKLTLDYDYQMLWAKSDAYLGCPNNIEVLEDLALDDSMGNPAFGGQNLYGIYREAIRYLNCNARYKAFYEDQIFSYLEAMAYNYFNGYCSITNALINVELYIRDTYNINVIYDSNDIEGL